MNLDGIRQQFPALALKDSGQNRVYFDNPAGTQVPQIVIDRMVDVLKSKNANLGGHFATTKAAVKVVDEAHQAMADFYNAASADEIVFGQNMTSLTFHFSRCLGRQLKKGDEIILSRMDHDANVAPWLLLAEDLDLVVKWLDFDTETYEFPDDALTKVLSSKTKLLAMGMASNCTGTVHDVALFTKQAKAAGALVYLDGVQYAPHLAIDVQTLGADVVVSSAYKWFGPHQGILWARKDLLQETFAYKVRAVADSDIGHKFETGTQSHEGMAGSLAAVDYVEQFGTGATRAARIKSAWSNLAAYEQKLTLELIQKLKPFKGLTIRGVTSDNAMHRRVPTVSFTVDGVDPDKIARHLAADNIFVWSGHNYALEPVKRMGLQDKGGVLRVGLAHYNTSQEVDALIASLHKILK
ncbi:cysteine desulfurase-like protein [Aestuariivirga litoralis]|nr:cysteine desulfurase-like protein [Aestuariivirga litoralis]